MLFPIYHWYELDDLGWTVSFVFIDQARPVLFSARSAFLIIVFIWKASSWKSAIDSFDAFL